MRASNYDKRVIVVSIPKAGTYLAAELLQAMGIEATNLHIRYDHMDIGVTDFSNTPKNMSAREKNACFKSMPFDDVLSMIGPGQFAVGHLPPLDSVKERIRSRFKLIFAVRDMRDCLISHMRYMTKIGAINIDKHPWCVISDDRERFKQYLLNYADRVGPHVQMKLIACWEYAIQNNFPGLEMFKLRFEDLADTKRLVADSTVLALADFLDIERPDSVGTLLDYVLGQETMTRSDGRTDRTRYWSPFAEEWFAERILDEKGNNMNRMLGYE